MSPVKNTTYTAVIGQSEGFWVGWVDQIPGVNCQSETKDGLMEALREALRMILEDDASQSAPTLEEGYEREPLSV